jgi:hypothetical protein
MHDLASLTLAKLLQVELNARALGSGAGESSGAASA